MPTHAEKRKSEFSAEQLFDLVADVERYPEFLPWCLNCTITKHEKNEIFADLVIGYKFFRERFTSRVRLDRPGYIRVEYLEGPLKYLSNEWKFIPEKGGGCVIDFDVDFEFRNPLFQSLMGVFFNQIVQRMVGAFETRARHLYAARASDRGTARSPSK